MAYQVTTFISEDLGEKLDELKGVYPDIFSEALQEKLETYIYNEYHQYESEVGKENTYRAKEKVDPYTEFGITAQEIRTLVRLLRDSEYFLAHHAFTYKELVTNIGLEEEYPFIKKFLITRVTDEDFKLPYRTIESILVYTYQHLNTSSDMTVEEREAYNKLRKVVVIEDE